MFDQKQFTLDWLQFIEQVKDRISREEICEFEYQLKSKLKTGKRVTFLIKVIAEKEEKLALLYPEDDEDIA
jgi:hypothetical protein